MYISANYFYGNYPLIDSDNFLYSSDYAVWKTIKCVNCYRARGCIDLKACSEMITDKFRCLPLLNILLIIDDYELIWISPIISSSINKYSSLFSWAVFFYKSDINW